jgi:hypothetical protein
MAFDDHEEEQSRLLREALRRAEITPGDLWLNYFSIGGSVGEYEVQAYLQGLLSLPALQRDLLACAANELIDEVPPLPRAPYLEDLQGRGDASRDEHRNGHELQEDRQDSEPGELDSHTDSQHSDLQDASPHGGGGQDDDRDEGGGQETGRDSS